MLAAYVDHGLSLAERAGVETHLASCPPCTALLAGVVRTVAEIAPALPDTVDAMEATPLVSRRAAARAAMAAAAVLAIVAAPFIVRPWLERDAGLVGLVGTVGEHRSVLGRLTGGFPHAPLDATSAGGQDVRASGTDRVLLTAGKIRESIGETAAPSRLHALGVSQLLERRYDDAAQLLLAASRQQPADARYLNDLATVQLERARRGLRPDDLPRALASADRARRLDPSLHEAWFNRALAMSALQLTDQAKAAWGEYLRRDGGSAWAGEARKHLEELSQPTPAAAWETIEGRLHQAIDAASAEAAVRAQTTEARNFIENDLLVAWADAVLGGNGGEVELDAVRVMADAMRSVAGDALYSDVVAAINGAGSADAKRNLALAHKSYAQAASLFAQDRFADAQKALTGARGLLVDAGSPFIALADVQLAAIKFLSGNHTQADAELAALHGAVGAKNYVYAAARATWFRGLVAFAQGRLAEARSHYEDTLATFDRMGDVEQISAAHGLLSGLHDILGDDVAEWQHRQQALAGLAVSNSSRFRYSLLVSAAISVRAENPEAALVMFASVVTEARQSGRDAAIVDALAQRAGTLHALGRTSEANNAIAEARAHLANVSDEGFRRLIEIPVLAVESDLLRASNAAAAAEAAQRAIDIAIARQDRTRLPQLQLRLARANIMAGNFDGAERALGAGIEAFDQTRAQAAGAGVASFDESWQLFDTAVQLAIRRGDKERAFALAERGRMRLASAAGPFVALADVQRAQRPDQAVIALSQFDDEMAVWVIRHDGTTIMTRPISRPDGLRIVARLHDEIRLETKRPVAGATLYDEIVRPIGNQLVGVSHLTFVPDLTYQDVSFAALFDRARQQFLVERMTVAAAPNVAVLAAKSTRPSPSSSSLLVLSTSNGASIGDTIADRYQQADIAVGAAATRGRLLGDTHAVMHLSVPTRRSAAYPSWSQLVLNDEPGRRYSGALPAREIAGRQLPATQLVVLDEVRFEERYRTAGTFDLATAFLTAGVPVVLGTLPGADESETRELMVGFHRQLTSRVEAAEALARVQRNALQQNGRRLGAWTALVIYGSDR